MSLGFHWFVVFKPSTSLLLCYFESVILQSPTIIVELSVFPFISISFVSYILGINFFWYQVTLYPLYIQICFNFSKKKSSRIVPWNIFPFPLNLFSVLGVRDVGSATHLNIRSLPYVFLFQHSNYFHFSYLFLCISETFSICSLLCWLSFLYFLSHFCFLLHKLVLRWCNAIIFVLSFFL